MRAEELTSAFVALPQGFFKAKAFLGVKLPFFTAPESWNDGVLVFLIACEAEDEVGVLIGVMVTAVSTESLSGFWLFFHNYPPCKSLAKAPPLKFVPQPL